MYIWSENVASRGGQEVGSCLIKHLKNHIPENTKTIKCYSDSCGGQNRNIKLSLMLKKFLHDLTPDSSIATIEQRYYIPGHSYNSCQTLNLIKEAKATKQPFYVTVMQENDFISSAKLEKCFVNRKKDTDGEKVNWLHIRSLKYQKDDPFHVHVLLNDGIKRKINMKKKDIDVNSLIACDVSTL